jgi:hypothetical protein
MTKAIWTCPDCGAILHEALIHECHQRGAAELRNEIDKLRAEIEQLRVQEDRTEITPRCYRVRGNDLDFEWIVGKQGGNQIRFSIGVTNAAAPYWTFVTRDISLSGDLPHELIERLAQSIQG